MRCVKLAEDGAQAKRTKEERLRLRISISKLSKYEAACQKLPKCCQNVAVIRLKLCRRNPWCGQILKWIPKDFTAMLPVSAFRQGEGL